MFVLKFSFTNVNLKNEKNFRPGNGASKRHMTREGQFSKSYFCTSDNRFGLLFKKCVTKCHSISNVPIRSGSKIQKIDENEGKFNLTTEKDVFCFFDPLLVGISKKEKRFVCTFFQEKF